MVIHQTNRALRSWSFVTSKGAITSALQAGHTVMVHERPISLNGWHGSGYIVSDNTTGNNAFMIGGGMNGGYITPEMLDDLKDIFFIGLASLVDVFKTISPYVGAWGGIMVSIASSFDDLYQCVSSGNRFNIAHVVNWLAITSIFVFIMAYLMNTPFARLSSRVRFTIAATLETMHSKLVVPLDC